MHELRRCDARLVFDLSCPEIIETLTFRAGGQPARRRLITAMTADRLVQALRIGHHFVASTSRQLDLWLGVAAGERLLTPEAYDRDPTLRSRFALAPHGVPVRPPRRSGGPGLHGTLGLPASAPVVLWSSAIWSWLDAETPIRAMAILRERTPQARLVFLGALLLALMAAILWWAWRFPFPPDDVRTTLLNGSTRAAFLLATVGLLMALPRITAPRLRGLAGLALILTLGFEWLATVFFYESSNPANAFVGRRGWLDRVRLGRALRARYLPQSI